MSNFFEIVEHCLFEEGKKYSNLVNNLDSKSNQRISILSKRTNKEPEELLKTIALRTDPTATETNAGKYTNWVIKNLELFQLETVLSTLDEKRFYKALDKFKNIKGADINKFDNINKVEDFLDKKEKEKATKKLKGQADKISGKFAVKKITSFDEAQKLGKGTKWCITQKEYFDQYENRYHIFYAVEGRRKYALLAKKGNSNTFRAWDETDERILNAGGWTIENFPNDIIDFISRNSNWRPRNNED